MSGLADDDICIVGVGETDYSSRSGRSTSMLCFEAVRNAALDARLDTSLIDGIVPWLGGASAEDLISIFGLTDVTYTALPVVGGAGSVVALQLAGSALRSGVAKYVVVFVARNGRSGARIDKRVGHIPGQHFRLDLEAANGLSAPAQWCGMVCRRHMHEFGTTREALGAVAVQLRENAQRNERAQMFGRPMSYEDYASSRVIAEPYLLPDCCLESDGAAAYIVTTRERARGLGASVVQVLSAVEGHPDTPDDLTNREDFFQIGATKAGPQAFAEAGVRPEDIDVAMLYDCFSFEVIHQLEEIGFCSRGEGGDFVRSGAIAPGGSLPVNTNGGLMSEGHLGGVNNLIEAVRQLRGECEQRQVNGAQLALVSGWGHLGDGGVAILQRSEVK